MHGFKMISPFALAAALAAGPILADESCHWEAKETRETKADAKGGSAVEKSTISADVGKQAEKPRFPEIKQADLIKALHDNSIFVVDANGPESYASAHIPGAVSFDKATGRFSKDPPADKNAPIVAYCGGPGCDAWCGAAAKLQAMGYKNIRHYKGGIKEWKQAGLETASAKNKG